MAGRKKEVQVQIEITTQEQWEEAVSGPGLLVIDVYQEWCGPCKAVVNIFKKLRTEYADDLLRFAVAPSDSLQELVSLRGKCQPAFVFYSEGKIVSIVKGVNGPLLLRTIAELLEQEKKKQELGSKYVHEVTKVFLEITEPAKKKSSQQENKKIEQEDDGKYYVVIIKPNAVAGGQVEEIIQKVSEAGYSVVAQDERLLNEEQVRDFYKGKSDEFLKSMSSGPVHAIIFLKGTKQDGNKSASLSNIIDPTHAELIKPKKSSNDVSIADLDPSDGTEMACRQLAFFFPTYDITSDTLKEKMASATTIQKTLALIRPSLLEENKEAILKAIYDSGFKIAMQKQVTFSEEQAKEFYKEHGDKDYFSSLVNQMSSGPALALALTREDAIQHWRGLLGPKALDEAKATSPECLRAKFAIDKVPINQLHGSNSPEEAQKELSHFFPCEQTLAVIKPDSSQEHKDPIINRIKQAGFTISQIKETKLTREMAEEFYKEHKGKDFYNSLVDHMSQGPSVVMVLSKENAIAEWREMMGPTNPDVAKETKPGSLRAQFAKSILENAVHGSSNTQHALDSIKLIWEQN